MGEALYLKFGVKFGVLRGKMVDDGRLEDLPGGGLVGRNPGVEQIGRVDAKLGGGESKPVSLGDIQ